MLQQRHWLYLTAFVMDAAAAGLSFAVSRRAAELGATAGELGWLGAVWIAAYAGAALLAGRCSDRFGRRQLAQAGCLVAALMAWLCAYTTHFGWLLGLSGAFGVAMAGFWPSIIAWLSEGVKNPGTLNARLGKFSVAWNLGLIVGFAQTGYVFRHWPDIAFQLAGGLSLLNVALLGVRGRPDRDVAEEVSLPRPTVPAGRGFRKAAWLANFSVQLTNAGASALFPQLATQLGIGADVHGGLLALGRAAALTTFVVLPALVFWRTRVWPLWVAQALVAAGVVLLATGSVTWLFAVAFLVGGLMSGYSYQASIFFTMDEVAEKGKGSGWHEAVHAFGMGVGPLVAGWAGRVGSLRTPYWTCAALLLSLIVVQMLVVIWRRRHTIAA